MGLMVEAPQGFVPLNELHTDANSEALRALVLSGMHRMNRDVGDAHLQPDLTITTRSPAIENGVGEGLRRTLASSGAFLNAQGGRASEHDVFVAGASGKRENEDGDRDYAVGIFVRPDTQFDAAKALQYLNQRGINVTELLESAQHRGSAVG